MEFIVKNKIRIAALVIVAVLAVCTGMTCFANMSKDVEISLNPNTGIKSATTKTVKGKTQLTVGELLSQEGYAVDTQNYDYNVDLNTKVRDVSAVTITKKVSGNITVDGANQSYQSTAATVGDVLKEKNITVGSQDVVTPAVTTAMSQDVNLIKVVRVETKEESHDEAIAFEAVNVDNGELAKGITQISTAGVNGNQKVSEQVTYQDGVETSRVETARETTAEPVTQVTQVGTKAITATSDQVIETIIPYTSSNVENPDLEEGKTQVSTAGVNGVTKETQRVTYEDGVEISRQTIDTQTTNPINEVIQVGTKKAVVETPVETPKKEETVTETPATQPDTTVTEEQPATDQDTTEDTPAEDTAENSGGNNTEASDSTDFDLICAIVAHEGGTSYEGSLAVISCVMNRVDAGGWGGSDALSVLTAPGQFASYLDGYYSQYMGADIPEVRQAVRDCMDSGIRSHGYTSFRSYETSGSQNICGNWYF